MARALDRGAKAARSRPGLRRRGGGWIGAALIGLTLATPARADGYVYWSHSGAFSEGRIGRADLDGDHRDRGFIRSGLGPAGVAVGSRHVFWINGDADSIGRARTDGSRVDQRFIQGTGFAHGLAIANGHIYWTRGSTIDADPSIARANLDGSGAELQFIPFGDPASYSSPTEIEARGDYVYWTNAYPEYTIGRARSDGSEVDQSFISGLRNPYGLAVTDSAIYWTNRSTRSIARADRDGGDVRIDFIAHVGRVPSLAADDRFLYWPHREQIMRARLDGSKVRTLIGKAPAESVAVDRRGPGGRASARGGYWRYVAGERRDRAPGAR